MYSSTNPDNDQSPTPFERNLSLDNVQVKTGRVVCSTVEWNDKNIKVFKCLKKWDTYLVFNYFLLYTVKTVIMMATLEHVIFILVVY